MNNKSMDEEISSWYSTYGFVTMERIFALMKIHMSMDELHTVSRSPKSPYYQLLQLPLKNIFNGIILNQATDYRDFAQKMLVDYLLSGAANLPPEATKPEGAQLEIETMRTELIKFGEELDLLQFEHYRLINESQKAAISIADSLPTPKVLQNDEEGSRVMEIMRPFLEQAQTINQRIQDFRKQFYDIIIKARDRLDSVPEYFNQFQTQPEHMEALHFDAKLGEEKKK